VVDVGNLGLQTLPGAGNADASGAGYSAGMIKSGTATTASASAEPAHVPSGAALLAVELSEVARGISGLDLLRRSVDRAPPLTS
jgi:hypothetical protein